jgi:hypothetical protein
MPKTKKLPWVPEWIRNSQRARVGLSVLTDGGKEPLLEEWEGLWEDRIRELAHEESVRDVELVQVWEELEGGWVLVRKVKDLLGMLHVQIAPGLWYSLWFAQGGDQKERQKLLEKFPQEDPAPDDPEELLRELEEGGLNGLVSAVADPTPHQRVWGL